MCRRVQLLYILLLPLAICHSWVEQLTLIDENGVFTGSPGYIRSFIPRTAPGFTDRDLVHILPPGDPLEARDLSVDIQGVAPSDPMCRKSQQQQQQSNGFPRLQASPGSMIALRYEENGHVTLPHNQPGKPTNRGDVLVYGTSQPRVNESFLDVFQAWTADRKGGDGRGRLLVNQSFDDARCYQINGGNISTSRQAQYPHSADPLMGADIWCQNNLKLPDDVPLNAPYTLYWVWDWPTAPGVDPNLPKGKAEIYTSCMDIDVVPAVKSATQAKRARDLSSSVNYNVMAIASYVSSMLLTAATPAVLAPLQPTSVANTSLQSAADLVLSALGPTVISELAAEIESQTTTSSQKTTTIVIMQSSTYIYLATVSPTQTFPSAAAFPTATLGQAGPPFTAVASAAGSSSTRNSVPQLQTEHPTAIASPPSDSGVVDRPSATSTATCSPTRVRRSKVFAR